MCFFVQAEEGIRDRVRSRGLGDVYKRQDADHDQPLVVARLDAGLVALRIRKAGDRHLAGFVLSLIHI